MEDKDNFSSGSVLSTRNINLVGFYAAILTAVTTIVTFGIAMIALPISGAFCTDGCIEYPYLNTVSQFPNDYSWMFPAIFLIIFYMILMVSIHSYATRQKKIFSLIGVSFAIVAVVILVGNYFVQLSVIPISLINGETNGIAILTQYNPHGLFIVLEDLGYLIMSISFLFMAPVFANKDRLDLSVKWVFISGFILTIVSLVVISFIYGMDRKDRFEVLAISVNWLVLLINGILLSIIFRRELNKNGRW